MKSKIKFVLSSIGMAIVSLGSVVATKFGAKSNEEPNVETIPVTAPVKNTVAGVPITSPEKNIVVVAPEKATHSTKPVKKYNYSKKRSTPRVKSVYTSPVDTKNIIGKE